MNVEEYQQWASDPLTVKFHQYLRDYRVSLMERWAAGEFRDEENLMAVAKCQMAQEIVTLDDDTISQFYRQTTKGSDDVSEDQGAG